MKRYYNLILFAFIFLSRLIVTARAEDYITFNVYHTPPEFLVEGKELQVTITIYEPENISHAFLSYRNLQDENFKIILLRKNGAIFSGSIPAKDIMVPWIEYFISAIDIKKEVHTLFHDYKHPYRISVYRKTPEEPAIKSPEEKRVTLAAGYAQNVRNSSLGVSIIDEDIIKQLALFSPANLLKNFSGLDIREVKNGLYLSGIRGFAGRNNQLQIRIDGRKLTTFVSGNAFWPGLLISVGEIEKIEVLKGPGSYIYGANAESGVIDITTNSFEGEHNFVSMFSAGNPKSISAYLHAEEKFHSFLSSITTNFTQSDYYETPETQALSGGAINVKTSFTPSYNIKFDLNAGYNKSKMPAFTTSGDYHFYSESVYTQMKFNFNKFYFNTYWNGDNLFKTEPINKDLIGEEIFRTNLRPILLRSDDFRLESSYSFYTGLWNKVLTGSEINITAYEYSDSVRKTFTEKGAGIFILDEIKPFEKLILSLSYRFDWNSELDPGNSYMGSITIPLNDSNTIRISQREGYRKPDYTEYTNSQGPLTHEVLRTTQMDYSTIIKGLNFIFSVYYNEFKNIIEFIPADNIFRNVAENAETFGGEVNFDWAITKTISFFANYSLLRGIDSSKEADPNHLSPDDTNPAHKINTGIILNNLNNYSGSLTVNYSSKYREDLLLVGIAPDTLDNYSVNYVKQFTTVNLRIGYSIFRNTIEFGLYGTNVLFKKHLESTSLEQFINGENNLIRGEEISGRILGYITGRF
jgi:outer membrane receptor protein involved in Fe transport